MYDEKRVDRHLHLAMLGVTGLAVTPLIFLGGVWLGASTVEAGIVAAMVGVAALAIETRARSVLSEEHDKLVEAYKGN